MQLLKSDWIRFWQAYSGLCEMGLTRPLDDLQKCAIEDLMEGYLENGVERNPERLA